MSRWVLGSVAVAASIAAGGCARASAPPNTPAATTPVALSFSNDGLEMSDGDCDSETGPCASVDLTWVVAAGGPAASAINQWVDARVRALLTGGLPGSIDPTAELDDLGQAFLDAYRGFLAASPTSVQRWSLQGQVGLAYHGGDLISLRSDTLSATGGAHPNEAVFWVSFDAGSGRRLALSDLVSDVEAVERLAELDFRRARRLDARVDLKAAGFTFPGGHFQLPDNFARVEDGLAVRWNAYDIASHAAGATDILLTTEQLGGLLRR
jgi:hypothetical protein